MARYRLTPDADRDLEGIWNYTLENWGLEQADRYLAKIAACCDRISEGTAICRRLPEIDSRLSLHHCERHFIFWLALDDEMVVIAVLHERMDLMARLARRLR